MIWTDRETLRYVEGDREVLVWVDFSPGFFSRTQIVRRSSLEAWTTSPDPGLDIIPDEKRDEIIAKVRQYYPCRRIEVE